VRIEQFDPQADTEHLRACFEMTQAGWPVDHPGQGPWALDPFAGKWGPGFDSAPRQAWLAMDGSGQPVGGYLLRLPDRENVTLADCTLIVSPGSRRRGIGSALIAHCSGQARRAGRSRLVSRARDGSPGASFASAVGAHGGIPEIFRTLTIDEGTPARLAQLRADAEPRAAGYQLASWLGPTPDEFLGQVARVHGAMADAPRDAGVEPAIWDGDRVRHEEKTLVQHGLTGYSVAARHERSGQLAALTQVCTQPDAPGWGFQQLTAVRGEHRGHRLGLLVKLAMLDLLGEHEPGVRHIETSNAGENAHMIAINEQLGFTITGVGRHWELDLAGDGAVSDPAARTVIPATPAYPYS
jgi:GNAT superfamily N-acetyltransferase/RimJ/RimL family protein N-acetyltransferase